MKSKQDIQELLDQLDDHIADDLEDQDIDFKEWIVRSVKDNVNKAVEMAVGMANGGGGTVVFGVKDNVKGREKAIQGVPDNIDEKLIQKTVYDRTDPHITASFDWIEVPEGYGRILVMTIFQGMPPYTETNGKATIRKGKDCVPFTGSMRTEVFSSIGISDITANTVNESWKVCFSAVAMERVRTMMSEEHAPESLINMSDEDLLKSIGALKDGRLTIGGLLIVGNNQAIGKYVPNNRWDFRRMISSTDYSIKDGDNSSIPVALYEMERYMNTENKVTTIEVGFLHPEFAMYPRIALREALLNAFVHRDYRIPSSVMLKNYPDKLILTNPGTFIGGITCENILHHPPVARNSHLADLLDKLRLVNRSNLGVPRIYRSLLIEGKEPPQYRQIGESIELTMMASSLVPAFRQFIIKMNEDGIYLDVDHLIVLNYLLRHKEIESYTASVICQRSIEQARELLSYMTYSLDLLQSGGVAKGKYFTLQRKVFENLQADVDYDRDKRLDREAIKVRLLSILKDRELKNEDIRQITNLDRQQVKRIMQELAENGVKIGGKGRGSYYYIDKS